MKIAFDVDVLAKQMDINRMVHQVSDWGYKYIEQSPHPRINPFYKHPLFSEECEKEYRKALKETGVEISSFIVVYRWSGPSQEQRRFAVANWKRMIQIAADMGVTVINTELSGDPNQQEICNGMWFQSMEELLPLIEREGIRVEIQSHPYDFCEWICCDESQWTYRPDIRTEQQLWNNFKYILEQNNKAKLDDVPLSDSEFAKIRNDLSHASFYDAGKWLVGENGKVYVHVQRGNETLHLVVMNNEHVAGGSSVYEVINQYQAFKTEDGEGDRDRRFDVTLLINGIPLIHIELKNKEHSYMDGYRQIKKYIAEGKFRGIFSNVQMFVVSNAVDSKYFSAARDTELNKKFITGWLDKDNNPICDYFAETIRINGICISLED